MKLVLAENVLYKSWYEKRRKLKLMVQNDRFTREFVIDFLRMDFEDRVAIAKRARLWDERLMKWGDCDFTIYVMKRALDQGKVPRLKNAIRYHEANQFLNGK